MPRTSTRIDPAKGLPVDHGTFPAEAALRLYAHRIISRLPCTEQALEFCIPLLNAAEIKSLIAFLREKAPKASQSNRVSFATRSRICHNVSSIVFENEDGFSPSSFSAYIQGIFGRDRTRSALPDPLPQALASIAGIFELSRAELEVLTFHFLLSIDDTFKAFSRSYPITRRTGFIALCSGIPLHEVNVILEISGRLHSLGLLIGDHFNPGEPTPSDTVTQCYLGSATLPIHTNFTTTPDPGSYPLNTFGVDQEDLRILTSLLTSPAPVNILLYGEPGTGKTEFTKALITSIGKTPRFLKMPFGDRGMVDRRIILQLVPRTIDTSSEVLVIDEADGLINTLSKDNGRDLDAKSLLNIILDSVPCTIVWISNAISQSHSSVRRRFSYSLRFGALSAKSRRAAWTSVLSADKADLVSPRFIEDASRRYTVNTAGIAQSVAALRSIDPCGALPDSEREQLLSRFLERHQELTMGTKPLPALAIGDTYDPAVLNTDTPPDAILGAIGAFYERKRPGDRLFMNLLLHGLPGTGKTEFTRYLATTLDRELIQKRASDLLSMWVGGTEKAIAQAFQEAETADAILLLDEADSLFLNREHAQHSWERSQTNELLTQMENFGGVLICCTNLLDNIDAAALRRFTFKVGFLPLTEEGRLALFRRYFPEAILSVADAELLMCLDLLTPGDFRAVAAKVNIGGDIDAAGLVGGLGEECRYKRQGRRIGFGV